MSDHTITHALVLAAGFGKRMQPLTETLPKPLVPLMGKPLIDHVLDRLAAAGVANAVVNVHYLPHLIERHLETRKAPQITISDEREEILDTGGAVQKSRHLLGEKPFLVHNSDSVWIEEHGSTLDRMIRAWNEDKMDSLLLLASASDSLGYSGRGDFHLQADGTVRRRASHETADYVFAGVSINHPRLFADCPEGAFSLNRVWNKALDSDRLSAIVHDGSWMHIGTPEALEEAERRLKGRDAA